MEYSVFTGLHHGFSVPVRDPLWGHVYFTPALAALTESLPFTRLSRIMQLGPAFCVYPGATHTRASHSIGVYHLARRLLANLYEKGPPPLSSEGVFSFLCAALLHDLGHFPYAHSLKELALEDHESLSARIILSEPLKGLVANTGADPELTAAIINKKTKKSEKTPFCEQQTDSELHFFRQLLSGVLDPDKLDYLNRDAYYCGVPYGAQDVDFIYSRLFPHPQRGIEIDSRGIPSVESILFSKYLMYRSVYWHRQLRSATAMIKKALLAGLERECICAEELYNLDDQGLFSLMAAKEKELPVFSLARRVKEGKLYTESASFFYNEQYTKDISKRKTQETALTEEINKVSGKKLNADSIIIDIPEPVSFETDLFVRDENCNFSESSSVFKRSAVEAFVQSLRKLRIFSAEALDIPKGLLQDYKNWLH